jgi:hypothetical protein
MPLDDHVAVTFCVPGVIPDEIRTQSKTDEMPPNAATPVADTGGSGDLVGCGVTKGRDEGTPGVASNPREAAARALTEAVLSTLGYGDLVATLAAARALEAFVQTLGNVSPSAPAKTHSGLHNEGLTQAGDGDASEHRKARLAPDYGPRRARAIRRRR